MFPTGRLEGHSRRPPDGVGARKFPAERSVAGIMTRHFGQRAIERAAAILRVGEHYSGHELDVDGRKVHFAIKDLLVWTLLGGEDLGRSIRGFPRRMTAALAAFCTLTFVPAPGFALDASAPNAPTKISQEGFTSVEQALRAGIDDLKAGDAASSVAALTYAAEGGQPIARWKLGEMYADGVGVARDDVKAYHRCHDVLPRARAGSPE